MSDTPRTTAEMNRIRLDREIFCADELQEMAEFCKVLERELSTLRAAFGIADNERIPEQKAVFGSVLVDSGSARRRIAPIDEEVIRLERELDAVIADREKIREWAGRCQNEMEHQSRLRIDALARVTDLERELAAVAKERDALVKQLRASCDELNQTCEHLRAGRDRLQKELDNINQHMTDGAGRLMENGDSVYERVRNAIQDREAERDGNTMVDG